VPEAALTQLASDWKFNELASSYPNTAPQVLEVLRRRR
jgi:hypothetical protein